MKIDAAFIADIEAAAKAATQGKWFRENGHSGDGTRERLRVNTGHKYSDMIADYFLRCADIDYIAAAQPANVLALIAELREARQTIDRMCMDLEFMLAENRVSMTSRLLDDAAISFEEGQRR